MAIVKASFTRASEKVKKILNYIVHRPGREGEELNRELFGDWEESIQKAEAYRRINASAGMTYFHVKLNFHAIQEDTWKDLNLRDITRQTITVLEERFQRTIRFLAVEHNDHTPLRHIHAIVFVKLGRGERIGVKDWEACTEKATEQAGLQRRALDAVKQVQIHIQRGMARRSSQSRRHNYAEHRTTNRRYQFQRVVYLSHPCPKCAGVMTQSLKTLRSGAKWCPIHGVIREERQRIRQEQGLSL